MNFEVSLEENPAIPPIVKFNSLLEKINTELLQHSFWFDRETPMFVIDKANKLNALKKDPVSQDALTNILNGLL